MGVPTGINVQKPVLPTEDCQNLIPAGDQPEFKINHKATTTRRWLVVIVIVVILLLLPLSLFLKRGFTNGWMFNNREQLTESLPKFCCNCSMLGYNLNEDTLEKETVNNALLCCASTPGQYQSMMQGMQARNRLLEVVKDNRKKAPENMQYDLLHTSAVAAHVLIGSENSQFQNNSSRLDPKRRLPIISLLPGRSLSLIKGVKSNRDRLIIQTTGIYLVYSQIYFKLIQGTNWPDDIKLLIHLIERYSVRLPNGGEEKLLQSVHTLTDKFHNGQTAIDFHSSYISGVIELHEGDELYVRVNSSDVISRIPTLNYIGVVKLSNLQYHSQ